LSVKRRAAAALLRQKVNCPLRLLCVAVADTNVQLIRPAGLSTFTPRIPHPGEIATMSTTTIERNESKTETAATRGVDLKLEVVIIPVTDVDRAKRFYGGLGWRLDADFVNGDAFRVVQFTPPGSPTSIHFGKGLTTAAPGSAQKLYLVVSDIDAARADLIAHG